jgi:hypothetical protein
LSTAAFTLTTPGRKIAIVENKKVFGLIKKVRYEDRNIGNLFEDRSTKLAGVENKKVFGLARQPGCEEHSILNICEHRSNQANNARTKNLLF